MKKIYNFLRRWIRTTKETDIGTLYMIFGTIFGIIGFVYLIKLRQYCSVAMNVHYLYLEFVISIYIANIFIFFSLMPLLISGFGNLLVLKLCGCSRVIFPRLNAISFWLLFFSFCFLQYFFYLLISSSIDGAIDIEIFNFKVSKETIVYLMIKCIQGSLFSTLLCLFNFSVTILVKRGIPKMNFNTPLYS